MPTAAAISFTDAGPVCSRARIRSRLGADSAWMLSAALRANAASSSSLPVSGWSSRCAIPATIAEEMLSYSIVLVWA